MKRTSMILVTVLTLVALPVFAEEGEEQALLAKLSQSKHSLLEAVAQAEKENGTAISAKFELEDGKLMLSVYTGKQGRDRDAEHNTLTELGGDAASPAWQPKAEEFEDKAHVARAAMQLTLMQLTKLSLTELLKKAGAVQKGTIYSAIPAAKNGKAVVDFLVATAPGKSVVVTLDAQTGTAVK